MSKLIRPLPTVLTYDDATTWNRRLELALRSAWGKDVRELQTVTCVWDVPEASPEAPPAKPEEATASDYAAQ